LHHLSIRSFREIDHLLSLFLQKERDVCASKQGEVNPVWMLRFVQHDKSGKCGCFASLSMTRAVSFRTLFFVIPSTLFCHSEHSFLSFRASARNPVWMLRFAQHDKSGKCGCFTSFSMTAVWSFRTLFFVIPNAVRNPIWMLRFAQHDKSGKCGCFASFSMTAVWSFRTLFFVIPSACEESNMDASLRSA